MTHQTHRIPLTQKVYLLVAVLLVLAPFTALAQVFRGGINGIVTDNSGGAVSGAKVVAVDTATSVEHDTVTSGAGEYSFEDLPLGSYDVTVTASGFQSVKINNITVQAGQIFSQAIKIGVANSSETIQVSAASIALDTTSTTNTTVIPDETVQNTPMNGRDFTQLIGIAPGFGGYTAGGFGSVNGTRANQVNWQIDGVDNNDLWHNVPAVNQGGVSGIAGITLPLDSIAQFSQQTEGMPENGRNPGGSVNVVTKSGTNGVHGSAYYYNRNELFAKPSPFSTLSANGNLIKNQLRNQQYGVSAGGPIIKDKLFWFVNYEKQQFIISSPASETEPSIAYQAAAQKVLDAYGIPKTSAQVQPGYNVVNTLWPSYSLAGPAAANNYSNASPITGYSYNAVAKMDYTINSNNTVSGRAFGGQGDQTAPVGVYIPYYFETAPIHVFNYSAIWNSTLSSSMTNQVLAGVNYFNQVFYDDNHTFDLSALGYNTAVDSTLSGAPGIKISGFGNLQDATPPSGRNDITGQISDTVSWVLGKHEFRFGGEFRSAQLDEFYQRHKRGDFTFDGSQGPWAVGGATSPSCAALATTAPTSPVSTDAPTLALADFLAGCAKSGDIVRGDTKRQVFVHTGTGFFQDAWQLTSHLNINYGARYDYLGPLHNQYSNLSVFRSGFATLPVPGIVFQGNQVSSLYHAALDNFAPRMGFAYQPAMDPNIVVRGFFGVFFDEPNLNPFLDNRPPDGGASGAESNPSGPSPVGELTKTNFVITPNQLIYPTSAVFNPASSYGLFSVNPNFRSAYNYNYTVSVERSFGPNVIASLGYVGSQARKLLIISNINQAPLGTTTNGALSTLQQNALRPLENNGSLPAGFDSYASVNEINSAGTSNYNSLQATLRTSTFHGMTSQFSYTFAHGLDEMTQYRGQVPQNSFNLKGDYGNMDYDTRNNYTAYLNYDIGWLKGPHWLSSGWQINSLMSFHGGQPYSVGTGTDSSGTGENEDRATQIGNPTAGVDRGLTKGAGSLQWISSAAFTVPTNAFGTLGRNTLYGPGYGDIDLSVFKTGHITERVTAQFRVEMFNLYNRANLAPPDGSLGDGSSFGTVTTTIGNYNGAPGIGPGEPFNTQFALKILF